MCVCVCVCVGISARAALWLFLFWWQVFECKRLSDDRTAKSEQKARVHLCVFISLEIELKLTDLFPLCTFTSAWEEGRQGEKTAPAQGGRKVFRRVFAFCFHFRFSFNLKSPSPCLLACWLTHSFDFQMCHSFFLFALSFAHLLSQHHFGACVSLPLPFFFLHFLFSPCQL